MGIIAYILVGARPLASDVQAFTNQFVSLDVFEPSRILACTVARSSLYEHIRERKYDGPHLLVLRDIVRHSGAKKVTVGDDGVLRRQNRICVPNVDGLYSEEVRRGMGHCRQADQVNAFHSSGSFLFLERLAEIYIRKIVRLHDVPVSIISDREFTYNNNYQSSIQIAPYEALYGRQCHFPVECFEPGEARLLGIDLVQDALDNVKIIQDRLRTAQSRQKSYADHRVRDVAFMVGKRVLLKVSPMKGVMRFGKKGNFSPRYTGPFEILQRVVRWSTAGKFACLTCMEDTKEFTLQHRGKNTWFGYHRRFLPMDHEFRINTSAL
ncbi:uncharacterized protein [Nicotiana tomentosiformis]|uniref:uncharacterized protein n=1 Tax=Nicotiana tomentosiformis TaxID=4098 RepID=UPI00388C4BCD